jgi:hypothetical protein
MARKYLLGMVLPVYYGQVLNTRMPLAMFPDGTFKQFLYFVEVPVTTQTDGT